MAKSRRVKNFINAAKDKANSASDKKKSNPSSDDREGLEFLKRRRGALFLMGALAILTLFGGLALGTYNFLQYKFVAKGPSQTEYIFEVPKGAGSSTIARKLETEELISSAGLFKILVRLEDGEAGLKAGEYRIPAGASLRDIYNILESGKAVLYPFTAAEGLTSAQIIRAMRQMPTMVDDNPKLPPEGSLLPETYMTPRGMTYSALLRNMQTSQTEVLDTLWPSRAEGLPFTTKYEAIILASVVEKETGIASEREMVAGVFVNRLKKGMRLQSDPTIIYGVTQGEPLGRGIRRSEIDRVTDWNTYQIRGLPKTPICNPGRESIAAVLHPAQTDALYFVADGTGGHVFAKTLSEHEDNVIKWRAIEKQIKAAQK